MARNPLFRSSVDAPLVAVKGAFLCRARWATCANRTRDHFFGQQQGQERWHLWGWFQICLCVVEPPWSCTGWTYSSRVLGGNPLTTNSIAHCWRQNFLPPRLSERDLHNLLVLIPLWWRMHLLCIVFFYWFVEKKTQTRTIWLLAIWSSDDNEKNSTEMRCPLI